MEKEYDDREVTLQNEEVFMLSQLTERERSIYFEGVGEGLRDGMKIILVGLLITLTVIGAILILNQYLN